MKVKDDDVKKVHGMTGKRNAAKADSKQGGLSLRIDIKLKAALTALAATQGRSLNAMINDALSAYLDSHTANTQLQIEIPAQPTKQQAQTLAAKYHSMANEIAAFEIDKYGYFDALDDATLADNVLAKSRQNNNYYYMLFDDGSAIATSLDNGTLKIVSDARELDRR